MILDTGTNHVGEAFSQALARSVVQDATKDGCDPCTALRRVSSVFASVAGFLPGPAGTVADTIAKAVALAADLAKTGRDPAAEIERIREVDPQLAAMRSRWAAKKKQKLES